MAVRRTSMAPTGQNSWQQKQRMQAARRISGRPFVITMALAGHKPAHLPQPMHLSLSTHRKRFLPLSDYCYTSLISRHGRSMTVARRMPARASTAVALRAYRTKKAPEISDAFFVYLSASMSKWLMPHFFRGHLCRGRRFPGFQSRLLPAHILSASAWPPGLSSWEPGSGPSHSGLRVQPGPS